MALVQSLVRELLYAVCVAKKQKQEVGLCLPAPPQSGTRQEYVRATKKWEVVLCVEQLMGSTLK